MGQTGQQKGRIQGRSTRGKEGKGKKWVQGEDSMRGDIGKGDKRGGMEYRWAKGRSKVGGR